MFSFSYSTTKDCEFMSIHRAKVVKLVIIAKTETYFGFCMLQEGFACK